MSPYNTYIRPVFCPAPSPPRLPAARAGTRYLPGPAGCAVTFLPRSSPPLPPLRHLLLRRLAKFFPISQPLNLQFPPARAPLPKLSHTGSRTLSLALLLGQAFLEHLTEGRIPPTSFQKVQKPRTVLLAARLLFLCHPRLGHRLHWGGDFCFVHSCVLRT